LSSGCAMCTLEGCAALAQGFSIPKKAACWVAPNDPPSCPKGHVRLRFPKIHLVTGTLHVAISAVYRICQCLGHISSIVVLANLMSALSVPRQSSDFTLGLGKLWKSCRIHQQSWPSTLDQNHTDNYLLLLGVSGPQHL